MKSSRSPSRTARVLLISTFVRRSFTRLWSSTYERIWWPQPTSVLLDSSLSCSMALAHFNFVQARFQHRHRFGAVAVLRAVVLALHDDTGRHVRDPHRGVGLVDVLTARARCAVRVDAQVGRVDLDFDRIVDFRVHEHRRERRVAAARRVERRLAHEAVDARFGAQEAVRVFARDLDRRVLDAGDVAVGLFEHFGLEALAFAVAQVLAQQHRCPVARLGAAGASLDVDEAVVRVGRVREHPAELDVAHACLELRGVFFRRDERVLVTFLAGQLEQVERVAQVAIERGERRDDALEQLLLATEQPGRSSNRSRRSGLRVPC